jgi:DNA-binding transcriptional LysR family regulator
VGEWRDGFFALDNWQVAPKLRLNYGFRYDLPTAPYSLNGYGRLLNDSQTALIPATTATSEGVDLSFRVGELEDSSLVARRLLTYRHQLVARPPILRSARRYSARGRITASRSDAVLQSVEEAISHNRQFVLQSDTKLALHFVCDSST